MVSSTFKSNLEFIDTNFPQALAEVLLESYRTGNKQLASLFSQSTIFSNPTLSQYKLKAFLRAVSLGMFPSLPWDGQYAAKGGILIVSKDSNIYLLDNIYHEEEVQNYLLHETKLDSPSSK